MKSKKGKGDAGAAEKKAKRPSKEEKPGKEKPKEQPIERVSEVAGGQEPRRGLWSGALGGMIRNNLLALALVIGGGAFLLQFLYGAQMTLASGEQARLAAEALAGRIADRVVDYQRAVERLAALPDLPELIGRADAAAVQQKEQALRELAPNALSMRLLPPDWELSDEVFGKGLSFAALDLVHGVEKSGKSSSAELHQSQEGERQFVIGAPIKGADGKLAGILLAGFGPDLVTEAVKSPFGDVRLSLQQVAGGKVWQLADNGVGEGAPGSGSGTVPVAGAIWQVEYWRGSGGGLFGGLLVLAVLGGGVAFVALVMLGQLKRVSDQLQADLTALAEIAEEVVGGRAASSPKARMPEMQSVMDVISRLRPTAPAMRPEKAVARIATTGEAAAGARPPPPPSKSPGIEVTGDEEKQEPPAVAAPVKLPETIFRAYDVRGVFNQDLTPEVVYSLGRAIGSEAYDQGQQSIIVARDGRSSGESLVAALNRGLQDSGRDVIDIGMVPTPVLYFATHFLSANSGVMVTGSHNPPEYNGLKIVLNGEALTGEAIRGLRQRAEDGNLLEGRGMRQEQDLLSDYLDRITSDVRLAKALKVVVDCGNGVAGVVAPELFRRLGCEVIELYCEVDGKFPNHHPDPGRPENLKALMSAVRKNEADLGIAFDGDGDRLGMLDASGKIIWPDRLLMLLARDVLARQPGADVIYDAKSSRHLASEVLSFGGRPIMWKTGHSLIKAKMKESGALLAGEMSGHLFIKERWYGFDDALYGCARILEILAADPRPPAEVFAELPESLCTPELTVSVQPGQHFALMEKFAAQAKFPGAKIVTVDGVRAEFEDGWGLLRPSNTQPALSFRFEADDGKALERIQGLFRQQVQAIAPDLKLPF